MDTDALYFDVYVDYFLPTAYRCDDGVGDAIVEIFYLAYMSEELQLTSSTDDCPASWAETWVYDSLQSMRIAFWELDAFSDDSILNLCWQTAEGDCTRVPKSVLHDGFFAGTVDGHAFEMSFYPRLSP